MNTRRWWGYALAGSLALVGTASAQETPQSAEPKQAVPGEQTRTTGDMPVRKLSKQGEDALARLYALGTARAQFARVGAEAAQDENARTFLRERAQDYEAGNLRVSAFAKMYGVDLQSEDMQKKAQKTLGQWQKENEKIRKAKPEQAAPLALNTFVERNDEAVSDLRQLRGEVQEDELRQMINQRIAALEEESTRAQKLRQQLPPASQSEKR